MIEETLHDGAGLAPMFELPDLEFTKCPYKYHDRVMRSNILCYGKGEGLAIGDGLKKTGGPGCLTAIMLHYEGLDDEDFYRVASHELMTAHINSVYSMGV